MSPIGGASALGAPALGVDAARPVLVTVRRAGGRGWVGRGVAGCAAPLSGKRGRRIPGYRVTGTAVQWAMRLAMDAAGVS